MCSSDLEDLIWVSDCCHESLVPNEPQEKSTSDKTKEVTKMAKCLKTGLDVILVTHQHEKHRCDLYCTKDNKTLIISRVVTGRGQVLEGNEDIQCADLIVNCDDFSLINGVLIVPANDCLISEELAGKIANWNPQFDFNQLGRIG